MADSDCATEEEWRPVVEFPGHYEVSSSGRIRRRAGSPYCLKSRLIKPAVTKCGYHEVQLRVGGRIFFRRIHRMVLQAFVGPCPPGMETRHLDGNPVNNRLTNLCWGTGEQNRQDMRDHGRWAVGERHGHAVLTEEKVRTIRRLNAEEKRSYRELAQLYGVSVRTIDKVINRQTWRHVI